MTIYDLEIHRNGTIIKETGKTGYILSFGSRLVTSLYYCSKVIGINQNQLYDILMKYKVEVNEHPIDLCEFVFKFEKDIIACLLELRELAEAIELSKKLADK